MSKSKIEHDYIVIGAGSGGLLVAVGLLKLGKDVIVVSENVGGDCTHYGCVPSKTLLHLAKGYHSERDLNKKESLKRQALQTVRYMIQSFTTEEEKIIPENRYIQGKAQFITTDCITVLSNDKQLDVKAKKRIIIATGSSTLRIKIPGVPNEKLITNEEFFSLNSLPKSISIIGGGPVGAEFATACAAFGIETHLISRSYLDKEPKVLSVKSLDLLQQSGVKYHAARPDSLKNGILQLDDGSEIKETEYYLLALGRKPNMALNLEKAQVEYNETGIIVNKNLTTTNSHIFAIGDCTQSPQFTHLAANHGKFVLKKLLIPFVQRRERALPHVTFVNPPIASVGYIRETAHAHIFELDFSALDRARTNFDSNSFGIVSVNMVSGHLLGVSLIGDFSEELINVFTLMIDEQISILSMSDFISPYPTYGNIFHTLSRDYLSFMSAHWKSHPIGSIKQIIRYIYS